MSKIKTVRLYLSEVHSVVDAVKVESLSAFSYTFLIPNFFRKGIHAFVIETNYNGNGWCDIEPTCRWELPDIPYKLPFSLLKKVK